MTTFTLLNQDFLAAMQEKARTSPRRRMNLNLHQHAEDACHRFFNAMSPDSYVVPHRHREAGKEETMVVVRGALAVIQFDETGVVQDYRALRAGAADFGVHIPLGMWHSVVALEADTVFLEVKGGPYRPLAAEDFAPWAPAEHSPEAAAYLESLRSLASR